jgi:hypothetical protein
MMNMHDTYTTIVAKNHILWRLSNVCNKTCTILDIFVAIAL